MTARPESALAAMTGRRLPGGCDDCDAYQVLSRLPDDTYGGVYVLTVHHDDTCPHLNGVTSRTAATRSAPMPPTTDDLARRLVDRGLSSPLILAASNWPDGSQQEGDAP